MQPCCVTGASAHNQRCAEQRQIAETPEAVNGGAGEGRWAGLRQGPAFRTADGTERRASGDLRQAYEERSSDLPRVERKGAALCGVWRLLNRSCALKGVIACCRKGNERKR